MAFVLKDGKGNLFKNEKRTADNQPNARGELMIDGVLYELSAWTKQGNKGPFQGLSAKKKDASKQSGSQRSIDDDLVF